MEKRVVLFGIFFASLILVLSVVVVAKPNFNAPNDIVPSHAVQVSEGVFSLGSARDTDGRLVEGFMFIDDRKGHAKPDGTPGGGKGGGKDKGGSTCYSLFAKDAKWKVVEDYTIGDGINSAVTQSSLEEWNSNSPVQIFGKEVEGNVDGADNIAPDGQNEVEFANLGPTNTIAYTIVWGIFGSPPSGRVLVEWDAVFNSDYAWSLNGEAGKMDYQNIATHEFGHALGLGHPESTCTEETMYASAGFGETKKRDLNAGDITGINKLY